MLWLFNRADKLVNVDVSLAFLSSEHFIVLLLLHLQAQVLLVLDVGPFLALEAIQLNRIAIDQILDHLVVLRDALLLNSLHLLLQSIQRLLLHLSLTQGGQHLLVLHLEVLVARQIRQHLCTSPLGIR